MLANIFDVLLNGADHLWTGFAAVVEEFEEFEGFVPSKPRITLEYSPNICIWNRYAFHH